MGGNRLQAGDIYVLQAGRGDAGRVPGCHVTLLLSEVHTLGGEMFATYFVSVK